MGRIRTIKPEFPHSESMGRVSREARLLFVLLWTLADDSGRLRGTSRMLASLLYPYDEDAGKHIDGWIADLERERCIVRYVVEDTSYVQVCNWLKHQKIDKPSPSKIPPFVEGSRILAEGSRTFVGGLDLEGIGSGPGSPSSDDAAPKPEQKTLRADALGESDPRFDEFWQAYGRKGSRKQSLAQWRKLRPTDALAAEVTSKARDYRTAFAGEPRYQKDGQRWLRDEGWKDEIMPRGPTISARVTANGRPVVEASTMHIPNMPLGHESCRCEGCLSFRRNNPAPPPARNPATPPSGR